MHWNIPTTLALFALKVAPALAGQEVLALWSSGTFTVGSPVGAGGRNGFSSGFSLVGSNGEVIYNEAYPDGYKACTHLGQEFTMDSGCFGDTEYTFRCEASNIGSPEGCEVKDPDGNTIGTGEGDDTTDYFGIGLSVDGACQVKFELADGISCGSDDEELDAHDTGGY